MTAVPLPFQLFRELDVTLLTGWYNVYRNNSTVKVVVISTNCIKETNAILISPACCQTAF